jgi:SecD/SecF fusion protein
MQAVGMDWVLLAQDAAAQVTEQTAASADNGWGGIVMLLIGLAVVTLPFVLGNLLANALRMKEVATRIGVTLLVFTICAIPFVIQPLDEALSLGIDLAGGTNLVYEIDREAAGKDITPRIMESMVEAVRKRVNPTGTEEVTVRGVGADRIEVIVPGADQEKVERTKRNIVNLGELEFALLANSADHRQLIELARQQGTAVKNVVRDGKVVAEWHEANVDQNGKPKLDPSEVHSNVERRVVQHGGKSVTEFLVAVDPERDRRITGRMLQSVGQGISNDGGLTVTFVLDSTGARLFREITTRYKPREGANYKTHLAILLNGKIESAPVINSPIPGGRGEINGRFTRAEIDELLSVLNAGSLVVPLKKTPVNESTVSPLLGIDVQEKGKWAMILSLAAVFVVTAAYYLQAGFVADVCLAFNLVMVLGVMSIINATFTLPGLAGLVLTIGMAVDANVLIFERMREELAKGSSLRMAIKNGFEKAFSTIFDSNVTTLMTAVVLYYIGTDTIKGFAVALFVGICTSLFAALYVGRLIFDIAERKKWLTDLKMFSILPANPRFDFIGKKQICMLASLVLIGLGLVVFGMRGQDNLDIDFRGGALVTFRFEDGSTPTVSEIRSALVEKFDNSISLEELEARHDGLTRKMYRLRTVTGNVEQAASQEQTAELVMNKVKEAFADSPYKLIVQQVTFGAVSELPAVETPAGGVADPFSGGHVVDVSLKEIMSPLGFAEAAQGHVAALGDFSEEDLATLIRAVPKDPGILPDQKVSELKLQFAKEISREQVDRFLPAIKTALEADPLFEEVNTFDSQVAGEAQTRAIYAMLLSLGLIIGYLWFRFQSVSFGLAAVVALVHDVLFTLGALAVAAYLSDTPLRSILLLEDFKINLPIVAAFLTIIGYSINDTIVVFDRIREVRGRNPKLTDEMVNLSLNQTLSRTLLTSATTLVVLLILYFVGGEGIHGFAFCLLLGILVGTYSSIYVAAPVLIWLMNRRQVRTAAALN